MPAMHPARRNAVIGIVVAAVLGSVISTLGGDGGEELGGLPTFAWLRADRSVYAHASRRVKDERLRMALSFLTVSTNPWGRAIGRLRFRSGLRP